MPGDGKPFEKGQSGNPAGRPRGSRNKFSEAFLADFLTTWEEHGQQILDKVARDHPSVFLRVAAQVLPKDVSLEVSRNARPARELTDDELIAIIREDEEAIELIEAGLGDRAGPPK